MQLLAPREHLHLLIRCHVSNALLGIIVQWPNWMRQYFAQMEHIKMILASKLVLTVLLDRNAPQFLQHLLIAHLEPTVDLEQQNVWLAQVATGELLEQTLLSMLLIKM